MSLWGWLQILAAASAIVVAALALLEPGQSPFRVPLAMLAANQFTWNAASVGLELTGDPRSAWLGVAAAPLFTPLALHYVLTFVGRRKRLRGVLWAAYAVFGAQTVLALVDALTDFELPGGFHTYAALLLVPSVPVAGLGLALAWRHQALSADNAERARGVLLIVALLVVVVLMVTDLLADLDLPVPRLATLGSFAFNTLLAQISLGIVAGGRSSLAGRALVAALFVAMLYLTLFVSLSHRFGVLLVSLAAVSFALFAGAGVLWRSLAHERAGLERFATFGRFSAQMAHDLKNPVAAAKGAAEFLAEELRRTNQTQHREFSELIVQQLDRLTEIIDRYQRLSTLTLSLEPVNLNALVLQVLSLQAFAASARHAQIAPDLALSVPVIAADPQLLSSALENVVKNAVEALPAEGGRITVSTHVTRTHVSVVVSDTGPGMNARTREQAFTLFFTTKATGSGLGLAFVQQIARAHRGEVVLTSRERHGTRVELLLPRGNDE